MIKRSIPIFLVAVTCASVCAILPVAVAAETVAEATQPNLSPATKWAEKNEFSFTIKNPGNLPLVKAVVNGTTGTFLLDTGAQITVLTPQFAKLAKLDGRIHQQGAQVNGNGSGVDFAMIESLKVGEAEFKDFHALLIDISHLKSGIGVEPAGIIGNNVLLQAPFTLDFRKFTGAWNSKPPEGAAAVPAKFENYSVYLAADLDGKRLPLLLDTASSVNAVYPKDWSGETITQGKSQVGVADGTREQAMVFAKVGKLNIGDAITEPAQFRVLDTHRCLGIPFLKGRAIHLDPTTQKVLLTPRNK